MLTDKEVIFLRKELKTAKNPLFLFDSDGDGLASFLLLYRINREGTGIRVVSNSGMDDLFMRKVNELDPDKIFILDLPVVSQRFIDFAKRPIFWIDHHPVQERRKVHYFNPRIKDPQAYIPTSRMAYQVSANTEDMWIAAAGCLADWHLPDFLAEFAKRHPSLLARKTTLANMLLHRKVGLLIKLFFFIQKGSSSDVRKSIKVLTRIDSPEEIFEQTTPQGKFLFRRFDTLNKMYQELLKEAMGNVSRSKLLLFYYTEQKWSFTANLANELAARYPKKVILIARRKSGEMKCSLRGKNVNIVLEKALNGINGRGGGHPDACGSIVNEDDWNQFLENLKQELK